MGTTQNTKTVAAVFNDTRQAEAAVRELEQAGFAAGGISVVANRTTAVQDRADAIDRAAAAEEVQNADKAADIAADAGIGAALGGAGGLLLGLAGLAIPGIGPVLASGPLIAALGGAGIGAAAGSLLGALNESGIPAQDAEDYAEGIRRGQVLVVVQTDEHGYDRARDILDHNGAVDVQGRGQPPRDSGWTGNLPGAEPRSEDEARRERVWYGGEPGAEKPHSEAHDISESLSEPEKTPGASRVYDRRP